MTASAHLFGGSDTPGIVLLILPCNGQISQVSKGAPNTPSVCATSAKTRDTVRMHCATLVADHASKASSLLKKDSPPGAHLFAPNFRRIVAKTVLVPVVCAPWLTQTHAVQMLWRAHRGLATAKRWKNAKVGLASRLRGSATGHAADPLAVYRHFPPTAFSNLFLCYDMLCRCALFLGVPSDCRAVDARF